MKHLQLGKSGITANYVETLKTYFKKNQNVKISVLSSARSEGSEGKKEVKKMSDEILKALGKNYTSRVIGFTIALKKWRKARE
jgi:RNA-binding protein YhbY